MYTYIYILAFMAIHVRMCVNICVYVHAFIYERLSAYMYVCV